MSYTIVSDVCEGTADCIPVCPVECIYPIEDVRNRRGVRYSYIDPIVCIDCGACLSVCPVEGAILDEWKPELQQEPAAHLLKSLVGRWIERLEVNLLKWSEDPFIRKWEPQMEEPSVRLLFAYETDSKGVELTGIHQLKGNLELFDRTEYLRLTGLRAEKALPNPDSEWKVWIEIEDGKIVLEVHCKRLLLDNKVVDV